MKDRSSLPAVARLCRWARVRTQGGNPIPNLTKRVFERLLTMRWQRYLAGMCVLCVLSVSRATPEFSAFISIAGDFRFIITNAETRVHSGWLSIGDKFEEHRLSRFNAADEVLTLDRGGVSVQRHLKHDPIEESGPRRRRVLSDGGADERRKREIPIWIDGWGNLALGATAVSFDEIEALFRNSLKQTRTSN